MWRRVRVALVPYCIRSAQTYTNNDRGTFLTEKKWKWVSVWQTAMPWLNIQRKTCFWHLRKGVNIWNRNINDQSYLQMLACGKFQWPKNLEESGIYISWPKAWIIALVKFACENYLFCVISYLKSVLTLRCRYKSPELKH